MSKYYFHNYNKVSENKNKKEKYQILNVVKKSPVDINILLNRVKIEAKKETKRKIIFFSLTTLVLSLFGSFILIIK